MRKDLNLIVMLTWHDVTVANAKDIFLESKGFLASDWGFKVAGRCGADHLLGTIYYKSVQEVCQEYNMSYSAFVALDEDTRMRAPIADVVSSAKEAEKRGVTGICLSAFRYLGDEPEELLLAVDKAVTAPFYIAGSVNSYERIDCLKTLAKLRGFTIGGAFFKKNFAPFAGIRIDKAFAMDSSAETIVFLDEKMEPLNNFYVWLDSRAEEEAVEINTHFIASEIVNTTGQTPIDPVYPAAKILWFRKNKPDLFKKIQMMFMCDDYILWKMSGQMISHGSSWCTSYLWDITKKEWWPDMGMVPFIQLMIQH
ncbi:carbohydrate kinase of FGGY family protein [Muricomes intestini]|uniref:Carbohydrate kinase of FGGY family protein n=1 Tax=Muricomes intestini TaxID=1796634 RepID=A0A4R3K970_9FIRM|nr:FGGY family carbohydrate kinase [Muricomes intestini]TCS79435.1 carbohydrate kinase of FGGY family protein [Muricomes intestini]